MNRLSLNHPKYLLRAYVLGTWCYYGRYGVRYKCSFSTVYSLVNVQVMLVWVITDNSNNISPTCIGVCYVINILHALTLTFLIVFCYKTYYPSFTGMRQELREVMQCDHNYITWKWQRTKNKLRSFWPKFAL